MEKFSYSKLELYGKCPFKYKLHYLDGHYIFYNTVATEFGTLIHYIEEHIGQDLKANIPIDYDKYLKIFFGGNDEVHGVHYIKNTYPKDWHTSNKAGLSYEDKTTEYSTKGIYRLEEYLKNNPSLCIYDTEMKFEVTIQDRLFTGSIDRILYDKEKNKYIIEDIKTYSEPLSPKELREALQMYVYTVAFRNSLSIFEDNVEIECGYDLPLLNIRQTSKIDMNTISNSLSNTFNNIVSEDFHPIPTALCHWCEYCPTNPNQPEEGKGLCPYYSLWTKTNKTKAVERKWEGMEKHQAILEEWLKSSKNV